MASSICRRRFNETILASAGLATMTGLFGKAYAKDRLNFQAIWFNDPEFIGYMIAIDNGYYDAEGLSINYMPGGPDVIPEGALLSGKADISLTNLLGAAKAISEKGAPLKIIGSQFQKSPAGVISMASSNIKGPQDLIDKTVACPPISLSTFHATLSVNNVPKDKVRIVPYTFDPTPLVSGKVDAVVDFVTETPFLAERKGGSKTRSFLFGDVGLPLYIDLVTVTADMLKNRRPELVKFLRASRKGWAENNADTTKYPAKFAETWFKGNGSSLEAENYHNMAQIALMDHPKGIFALDDAGIEASLASLGKVGLKASKDMFDTSVLADV